MIETNNVFQIVLYKIHYILVRWDLRVCHYILGVPKVQKYMVFRQFPIHLDPRSSPSEKFSKFFEIYYQPKLVEVLPSKLPSSDFGQSECGSKNP